VESLSPRARLTGNLGRRKIPGLDGIRGVSVLAVTAFHGVSARVPGNAGVQMFFLLSGLLITWLMLEEEQATGGIDWRAFYGRRAVRLLPALFALLLWEIVVGRPRVSAGAARSAALYYANYYLATGGDLTGVTQTWSLSVEEHFYLAWPVLFLAVRNRKALMAGCFLAAAAQTVLRAGLAVSGHLIYSMFATETSSIGILAGCGLALFLRQFPERLPEFLLRPWLAWAAAAGIVWTARLPAVDQAAWGIPAGIAMGAVILLQAVAREWRLLDNPVTGFLGRISYGIYLWHLVAIDLVKNIAPEGLRVAALFGCAVTLGGLSYFAVERPAQAWARRHFRIARSAGPHLL